MLRHVGTRPVAIPGTLVPLSGVVNLDRTYRVVT